MACDGEGSGTSAQLGSNWCVRAFHLAGELGLKSTLGRECTRQKITLDVTKRCAAVEVVDGNVGVSVSCKLRIKAASGHKLSSRPVARIFRLDGLRSLVLLSILHPLLLGPRLDTSL